MTDLNLSAHLPANAPFRARLRAWLNDLAAAYVAARLRQAQNIPF